MTTESKNGDRPFTMAELLYGALGIEPKAMTKAHEMRAAKILRRMGYETRQLKVNGRNGKYWVKVTTSQPPLH
jgi:hypothetical protein